VIKHSDISHSRHFIEKGQPTDRDILVPCDGCELQGQADLTLPNNALSLQVKQSHFGLVQTCDTLLRNSKGGQHEAIMTSTMWHADANISEAAGPRSQDNNCAVAIHDINPSAVHFVV
jgi:hypothetical protein